MAEMKYVIVDGISPILFIDTQNHDEFKKIGTITGAGRVMINYDREQDKMVAQVFGESWTLDIKSNKDDERIINRVLDPY